MTLRTSKPFIDTWSNSGLQLCVKFSHFNWHDKITASNNGSDSLQINYNWHTVARTWPFQLICEIDFSLPRKLRKEGGWITTWLMAGWPTPFSVELDETGKQLMDTRKLYLCVVVVSPYPSWPLSHNLICAGFLYVGTALVAICEHVYVLPWLTKYR